MERLSLTTQTVLAELMERLQAIDRRGAFAKLRGGFARKRVKGRIYWYFRTSEGVAGQREFLVGADDDPAVIALMAEYRADRSEFDEEAAELARLSEMVARGGALATDAASEKVIAGLAVAGVFRLGGMLVGTHAFAALGNLLGVRWSTGLRTQDIDVAAFRSLEVAVPESDTDVPGTLDALKMGFLPVPGLDPRSPATSFKVRGRGLRVDLLTPAQGSRRAEAIPIRRFHAAAEPIELLGYLLADAVPAVVIGGRATLVRTPSPARFALHKLVISRRRHATDQTKAQKDVAQATELLRCLATDRPGDVTLAVDAARDQPPAFRRGLGAALRALPASDATWRDGVLARLNANGRRP